MRHIEVKDLWLQEAICRSWLKVVKMKGEENPTDVFTKYLIAADTELQCARMNVELVREQCVFDMFRISVELLTCGVLLGTCHMT